MIDHIIVRIIVRARVCLSVCVCVCVRLKLNTLQLTQSSTARDVLQRTFQLACAIRYCRILHPETLLSMLYPSSAELQMCCNNQSVTDCLLQRLYRLLTDPALPCNAAAAHAMQTCSPSSSYTQS